MRDFAELFEHRSDERPTYYGIVYLGGSNPGVPRRFVYDPELGESFYQISKSPSENIVLLDAALCAAITDALATGDYSNVPSPLTSSKLEGKARDVQLGYARRQLKPAMIQSMREIEVGPQEN